MILERIIKNTHKLTCRLIHTVPLHPTPIVLWWSLMYLGINRSAQSSSHPALKSFPEVVLQKPAAEEDKRVAIPRAQRLLSLLFAAPSYYSIPRLSPLSFHPSLFLSPFFSSESHAFCPTICTLLPSGPSYNSPFHASLSCSPPILCPSLSPSFALICLSPDFSNEQGLRPVFAS